MTYLFRKAGALLLLVALVCGALFGVYHYGETVTNAEWQSKWNDRNARDATAKAQNEAAARAKEQAYQQAINKVTQDGQQIIDQATVIVAILQLRSTGRRIAHGR